MADQEKALSAEVVELVRAAAHYGAEPEFRDDIDMICNAALSAISLQSRLETAEADAAAVRELMNVYDLGGWTDAVAPMKRALTAESKLAAAEQSLREREKDAARYRWLRQGLQVRREEAMNGKHYPFIYVRPGRCLLPHTVAAEANETLDAAIDAALTASSSQG